MVASMSSFWRWPSHLLATLFLLAAVVMGYEWSRSRLAGRVYQRQLRDLAEDYRVLQENYRTAVRKTAVTELLVDEGELSVSIRTAAGELKRIATPFDPAGEVYIDYIVVNGRLWIRRVFDDRTPPNQGVVIDPALAELDWTGDADMTGKAVYRRLSEGRWLVTVTGNGALGIKKAATGDQTPLPAPPSIHAFSGSGAAAGETVGQIGFRDVLREAVSFVVPDDGGASTRNGHDTSGQPHQATP